MPNAHSENSSVAADKPLKVCHPIRTHHYFTANEQPVAQAITHLIAKFKHTSCRLGDYTNQSFTHSFNCTDSALLHQQ
jgi:hypothetical protein